MPAAGNGKPMLKWASPAVPVAWIDCDRLPAMDFQAGLVDQWVQGLCAQHPTWFADGDPARRSSRAFVFLCVKSWLSLDDDETLDCITDGGQDGGIDALHIGGTREGEFVVTLFQGKYKRDLDGRAGFPAGEIQAMLATLGSLFDPSIELPLHLRLRARIAELRSRALQGDIPRLRVILCNNGARWDAQGDAWIAAEGFPPDQVSFHHVNHEWLIAMRRQAKQVSDIITLAGQAIVEDHNYRRVLIGKVQVGEIRALLDRHGDDLLERNIRRYLGTHTNPVNQHIAQTLRDPDTRANFYFFNNGITMVCRDFRHNALTGRDFRVQIEDLQILNGGQTCKTIQQVLRELSDADFSQTFVLLRLYAMKDGADGLIDAITYATNHQTLVDLRDLRANDAIQQALELGLRELGITYRRKREASPTAGPSLSSMRAAEAVLAIWRRKPHTLRMHRDDLFGWLYPEIFRRDLSAAQVALADEIYQKVDHERQHPSLLVATYYQEYATGFLAMDVGDALLAQQGGIKPAQIDHRNLPNLQAALRHSFADLYRSAHKRLVQALGRLGIDEDTSLQKVAGAFRSYDLLDALKQVPLPAV